MIVCSDVNVSDVAVPTVNIGFHLTNTETAITRARRTVWNISSNEHRDRTCDYQDLPATADNVVSDVGSVVTMSAYDDVDVCNGVLNCGVLVAAVAVVLTTSKHSHPTSMYYHKIPQI